MFNMVLLKAEINQINRIHEFRDSYADLQYDKHYKFCGRHLDGNSSNCSCREKYTRNMLSEIYEIELLCTYRYDGRLFSSNVSLLYDKDKLPRQYLYIEVDKKNPNVIKRVSLSRDNSKYLLTLGFVYIIVVIFMIFILF